MGTSNGSVLGVTKIVDNGSDSDRYNIVLLSDGYTSAQMGQWALDAQEFADYLFTQAPFSDLDVRCGINVHRVDVTSDESGADDPDCDDGGGSASTADTYFDASFCGDGRIRRLLVSDSSIAIGVLNAQVPGWDTGLVVVNHADRGGAGGQVPTTSTGGDWMEVALHELGHSAFGLADEYEYWVGCGSGETDRDNHPGVEPSEPNVTTVSDRATIKWASLVDAATPMPTTQNADCSQCDTQANPVAADAIGAFEGAHYFHCGAFRPNFDCKMRNTGRPFCAVCRGVIRDTLAPYLQPTTVTLVTPTLAFTDVEEGTTTARGVAVAVSSCAPLRFRITDGPRRTDGGPTTAGGEPILGTPLGLVSVSASPPRDRTAYVWVTYRATNPGDTLAGTVTVRCEETGDEWTVPITANTVPRVTVGVMLSLDTSGSMLGMAAGGVTKAAALRDAAEVFVDVIPDHDGVGVNTFNTDAYPGVDVEVAGSGVFGAGRIAARTFIRNNTDPDPAGMTAIGDAVELSDAQLAGTTGFDARAMIVFTDGEETEPKYISEVSGLIASNPRIFAIGLGTAQNLKPATLQALCSGNDGYLLVTGASGGDTFFRLAKYFLQILAGLTNAEIVLDPEGFVALGGPVVRIPFDLAETDTGADVVLVTPLPPAVAFGLETPAGDVVGPADVVPGVEHVVGQRNAYYRVSLPTLVNGAQAREGRWHALLQLDRKGLSARYDRVATHVPQGSALSHGLPFSLVVHARSNLKLVAACHQGSHVPGATLRVRARLTEYGLPVDGRATVRAEVTRPDGSQATLAMPEVEPGAFEAEEVAHQAGVYHFRVLAMGQTLRGRAFTREQLVTGFTYRGGDDPDTPPRGEDEPPDWCRLLECLLGALTPEARKRLEGLGVDVERLVRCLGRLCTGRRGRAVSQEDLAMVRDVAARLGIGRT